MSTQLAIDFSREVRAAERGKARAGAAHHTDLRLAREIARELGADGSEVWADRVREVMAERWPDIEPGNWLGALFRGGEWRVVGFVRSKTAGSHGNRLLRYVRKAEA